MRIKRRIVPSDVTDSVWKEIAVATASHISMGTFYSKWGGSGYLACDAYLDNQRVFIKGCFQPSESDRQRFLKEAKIIKVLESKSQLSLVDLIQLDEWQFLITNWIDGSDLLDRMYLPSAIHCQHEFRNFASVIEDNRIAIPRWKLSDLERAHMEMLIDNSFFTFQSSFEDLRQRIDNSYIIGHMGYFSENIRVLPDGRLVLLDFGSVKYAPRLLEESMSLAVHLSTSYSDYAFSLQSLKKQFSEEEIVWSLIYWWSKINLTSRKVDRILEILLGECA